MHFPYIMRRVNRVFTNPVLGSIAWLMPPLAIVHHVGRKSGRRYRTPVVAFRKGKVIVVPMTYGRDVDWGRNLVAAGGGEIQQAARTVLTKNPRIVDGAAAGPFLPAVVRPLLLAARLPGFVLLDVAS